MDFNEMWPSSSHDAFLVINEYDRGVLDGYLIHPRYNGPQQIKSISHLIRILDQGQGLGNTPYNPLSEDGLGFDSKRKIASFTITVLFRQNYTIQGKLVWNEESKEAVFRSGLELIYLLDDILTSKKKNNQGA